MNNFLVFYKPYHAWYNPQAAGYTDSVMKAGRFSREDADKHAERAGCCVVEDGSEEMQSLCNRWERYFIPKLKQLLLEAEEWKKAAGETAVHAEGLEKIVKETAKELGCKPDEEDIGAAIQDMKADLDSSVAALKAIDHWSKHATPIRLMQELDPVMVQVQAVLDKVKGK